MKILNVFTSKFLKPPVVCLLSWHQFANKTISRTSHSSSHPQCSSALLVRLDGIPNKSTAQGQRKHNKKTNTFFFKPKAFIFSDYFHLAEHKPLWKKQILLLGPVSCDTCQRSQQHADRIIYFLLCYRGMWISNSSRDIILKTKKLHFSTSDFNIV